METRIIGKWDYRWKIISMTLLILSIASIEKIPALLSALFISVLLIITVKIRISDVVKSITPLIILLVIMSPFIIFTPGQTLLGEWHFLKIYTDGLKLLFTIAVKAVSIFLILTTLLYKADISKLMQAMNCMGIPGKMISILISTYRYIYLYMEDMKKLFTAAKLRGFHRGMGFSHMITSADIMLTLL
ncbi:MAG: hypothetical protein JEY91_19940, partial [Spirochaetaceae bacterium]|nr:hypothetical protein [Spirochaetaceae bacterium]